MIDHLKKSDRFEKIIDSNVNDRNAFSVSSSNFALMLIANLILLNAGAIIAIPAYLQINPVVPPVQKLYSFGIPTILFLFGLVFSFISGFLTHLAFKEAAIRKALMLGDLLIDKKADQNAKSIVKKTSSAAYITAYFSCAFFLLGIMYFSGFILTH